MKLINSSITGLKLPDSEEIRAGFVNYPINLDKVLYIFPNGSYSFNADSIWFSIDFFFDPEIIIRWYYEDIETRNTMLARILQQHQSIII